MCCKSCATCVVFFGSHLLGLEENHINFTLMTLHKCTLKVILLLGNGCIIKQYTIKYIKQLYFNCKYST